MQRILRQRTAVIIGTKNKAIGEGANRILSFYTKHYITAKSGKGSEDALYQFFSKKIKKILRKHLYFIILYVIIQLR